MKRYIVDAECDGHAPAYLLTDTPAKYTIDSNFRRLESWHSTDKLYHSEEEEDLSVYAEEDYSSPDEFEHLYSRLPATAKCSDSKLTFPGSEDFPFFIFNIILYISF